MKTDIIVLLVVIALAGCIGYGLKASQVKDIEPYQTELYTASDDILYLEHKGDQVYRIVNENGGIDLTIEGVEAKDKLVQALAMPTSSSDEYYDRIFTVQNVGIGKQGELGYNLRHIERQKE